MLRKCITFIGTLDNTYYMKSDNLQYNTLGRWDERLIDQASDVSSIIFFIFSYSLRALKTLYFYEKKIETIQNFFL